VLLDLCHVLSVLLSCALLVTVWSVNTTYSASSRIVIHTHRKHALLKVRYAAPGLDPIFRNSPSRAVVNNTGFSLCLLIVKEKIDDVQCSQEHYHAKIQVVLKDFRGVSVIKRSRHMSRTSRGLMRRLWQWVETSQEFQCWSQTCMRQYLSQQRTGDTTAMPIIVPYASDSQKRRRCLILLRHYRL
jgi:hypothetical protein